MSRHHYRCPRVILDALGQSWFIFKKHKQIYIFGVSGVMFDMKDSLKGLEESASHPPPSPRGSAPSSSNEEFSTSIIMIFDALSDGINAISPTYREPMEYRHDFAKIMKNGQKSMFTKTTQDYLGDV